MPITALPTPPSRNSPSTFADVGDAFLAALPTFGTEANTLETNVNAKEVSAAASALAAAGSATAAGAIAWVAATSYVVGNARYSPIDGQTYRCISETSDSTDPSANPTKWVRVNLTPTTVYRSARTSNTILGTADRGYLIDITSGTFTQTFTAAATLTSGWFCWIRNSGTGDITLDPNASETIDGLTSYVMYPGESRLVQCDGTGFYSVVLSTFYKVFTASGTFTRPPGYNLFGCLLWGAGGGGGIGSLGGGGGACSKFEVDAATVGATRAVTIGAGGAGVVGGGGSAKGGDSVFITTSFGGGRGNNYSEGGTAFGTSGLVAPYPSQVTMQSTNYAVPVYAFYGGGCDITADPAQGYSIYGGGSGRVSGTAGQSVFGGAGGVASAAGTAPGGGGGGNGTTGGAGARGELRIWGIL